MLKDLLEQFAILEGDVVSFADFKAKKDGEEIKEEPKTDGKKQIEIKSIKIIAKEGKQDGNPFELGKEYSYEEAQRLINEADYIVWNRDLLDGGYDKTDYIATILVNGEEDEYKGRIDLGDGKSNIMAVNIKYTMQHFLDSQYPNEYFVNAPDITYDYEEFAKKYGTKEENINKRVANNKKELPTGVNSAAKSLDEIGIGDIFVKSGYDDYYRRNYYVFFEVTKRTKSSVWLRPIGSKKIEQPINNNGQLDYENYCIPDVAKERQNGSYRVDFEKPYRLSLGYDNEIQCSQGSGYRKETYYAWNGKALKEGFEMKKSIYAKLNEDLKPYLHEFYDVEGLDSVEMTIVSLGMEDGIETLELDGVQFCRAEDEELSNAIDICIEEEFMPEWEEQGIVSYNVDSVLFDKEDGNGVAYIGLFRGDDLDETVKENKAEELKKLFDDAFKGGKMNCFETAKGVVYFEPQGEQLVYGDMTNGGIIPEYKFDYDFNHSFDWNLQGHIEQIMEEEGYPIDESYHPFDTEHKVETRNYKGVEYTVLPDGDYCDIKIYAPKGQKFYNGDTWYSTSTRLEAAEKIVKEIVDGQVERGYFVLEESLNEESVEEKLQKIADEVKAEINKIYADDKDLLEYFHVESGVKKRHYDDGSDKYFVEVRGELNYEEMCELGDKLDPIVQKYDEYAYFDMVTSGIMEAVFVFDRKEPEYRVVIKDEDGTTSVLKYDTYEEAKDICRDIAYSPKKDSIADLTIEKLDGEEYKVITTVIDKVKSIGESLNEAVEKYPKQLAQAIKKCWYGDYKDKGRYAKIGKWEIGLGGYDTGYEVSFDGTPIFAIRTTWGDNKVDMYQDEKDIKNLCGYNFKQIMKAINEVDPETILNEPEQMYRLVIKTDEDNLSDVNEILGHYSEIEADDIDDNSYDSIICFYVNKNDQDILNQIYKDLKELNNDAIELKEPFEIY